MEQSLTPVQSSPDTAAGTGAPNARLLTTLRGLGAGRLALLGAAAAGLLGFFAYLVLDLVEPQYGLLYSNLDLEDSAEIVGRLEAMKVPYRLRADGATIQVPADQALRLRMTLAEDGLPRGGSVGYEIFDQTSKTGAREFLPFPPDPELIAAVLEAVGDDRRAMVFEDPATREVLGIARQIAPSDASVLITGESGTGKEMVARYLHRHSRRADKAFVSVNCAAIPEHLLESQLFGHEKGAFTGATSRRIGKFEGASGGTLLLDEISEMDPRLQAKLLRAVQEREIDRVGAPPRSRSTSG